ncbi:MAG: PKD domain-containing protein [Candidatus Altiarchaeota archaeon]
MNFSRKKFSFFLLLIFMISSAVISEAKSPIADARCGFSSEDVTQKYVYAIVGERIYFDGSKSFDLDKNGYITGYYWDFDDGFTAIGQKVEHKFSSPGKYIVRLIVVDNENTPSVIPSEISVYISEKISAKILKPRDNSEFIRDTETIEFLGNASGGTPCYEKPNYKYLWKSNVVGVIGNEKEFSLRANSLPLGWHTITLEIEDCLGNKANDTIAIAIVEPLKAEILETCKGASETTEKIFGRVVFDSSWVRFIPYGEISKGIFSCNNSIYVKNIAKWLDHNGKILIYILSDEDEFSAKAETLKNFLSNEGYDVDLAKRPQKISYELLSQYGQVWFIDTERHTTLDDDEINAILKYHNNKGNLLLSGEVDSEGTFSDIVNKISENFKVSMKEKFLIPENIVDEENCISASFLEHELTKDVKKLSTSKDDLLIRTKNPNVKEMAIVDAKGYIFALDYEVKSTEAKSYICDCEVKFTGKASGGMPPYEVKWISLEDGVIDRFWINSSGGTYTLLSTPPLLKPLTEGTHAIKFEVVDSLGMRASDIRYEVNIKWCCALGTNCKTYWPKHEGPLVTTGNEIANACDVYEVCHPDLWQLAKEAIECCKWKCSGRCHEKCNYVYLEGERLGTTPEGLNLDGLKKCAGLYIIYGFGKPESAVYMSDYFWPEICCLGHPLCLVGCCSADLGKCRCCYHSYTKNVEALPCRGAVANAAPIGWASDAAMNKNSCTFSDLSAHMSILGDQGVVTSASGINTGTCCDYANSLATMLRIVGYKPDEVYANTGPGHCYNLVKFPQDDKFHIIDTTGNCYLPLCGAGGLIEGEPYVPRDKTTCGPTYPYCSYFDCRNDMGMAPCPEAYGC